MRLSLIQQVKKLKFELQDDEEWTHFNKTVNISMFKEIISR